jgi:hypothetical protein
VRDPRRRPRGVAPDYTEVTGILIFAPELKAMLSGGQLAREADGEAPLQLLSLGSAIQPRMLLSTIVPFVLATAIGRTHGC